MAKILLYTHKDIIETAGGAEKVFVNMANELSNRGHDIVAVCNSEKSGEPFYELDEEVEFINLYNRNFNGVIAKSKANKFEEFLYKNFLDKDDFQKNKDFSDKFEKFLTLEKPDLIICHFLPSYREISYAKDYDIPTIMMFHSYPDRFFNFFGKKYFPINRIVLNKVDMAQVLLPSHVKNLQKYFKGQVAVIGNAVGRKVKKADLSKEKDAYTILNISRLDKFKRQDILIKAFSLIANKYPNWQVHLYGQFQPQEHFDYIDGLIKKYNLESQIKYMGITDSPMEVMKEADIFVLPSDFEGFSLATAEAMNVGLPCVAFEDCAGVNEIITNDNTGLLCGKSPEELAVNLEKLILDRNLRIELGINARKSMKAYSSKVVWDKWEDTVYKILESRPSKIKKMSVLFEFYIRVFEKA